jgi:signal peptidase I
MAAETSSTDAAGMAPCRATRIRAQRCARIVFVLVLAVPALHAGERFFTVGGTSMLPTLRPGDRVAVDTTRYRHHLPRRDELVAIDLGTGRRPMVKRIVALPGDSIAIDTGTLSVNDSAPRSLPPAAARLLSLQLAHYGNRLPPNTFIVLGDNGSSSYDSGDFGLVAIKQVMGRVRLVEQR